MSSGSHLSKELFDLIRSIGDCKSKQEEDKIILNEITGLKSKLQKANVKGKQMKELMIRAIYCEMLGHDASFSYIYAVNLTGDKNLICKRSGYLACTLFLSPESELMILLVSTLQKDLQSPNHLEISSALVTLSKLLNVGIMHAVMEPVIRLMNHTQEIVRKKAISVLYRFFELQPALIEEHQDKLRKALCDRDPSVMSASLHIFYMLCQQDKYRAKFKDLVPSFVVILKQIIDHRLPRDFDYHRLPAPWIQIRLLQILGVLGMDDQNASEGMYEIINEVLRRADDTGINAGYAIVYQCVKTITQIYPQQTLLEQAANSISKFISSDKHNNLKYLGITGLAGIIKVNSEYVVPHQMIIVECIEDPDETLKIQTLELLYRMTNANNVEVIVDKLMSFLRNTKFNQHLRMELVEKISELAERYAPDNL